jgi:4a-hydroxytetrahydrobiopterin dehydratase
MAAAKLSDGALQDFLGRYPNWKKDSAGKIARTYTFQDFKEALVFVNAVGFFAEKANHHPDIGIEWNKVTLSLITHDAGGVTQMDLDFISNLEKRIA